MHVNDLLFLKWKIILVTGGSGKYGSCLVEGIAEAGGTVITSSRDLQTAQASAEALRKKGLDVHGMQLDQGDHASVVALKENIVQTFERLDGFVNNAVSRPMKGYGAPLEQFEASMQVNATGMVDLLREMTDLIVRSGGGSVVNIASMMGMRGPDLSNYEG